MAWKPGLSSRQFAAISIVFPNDFMFLLNTTEFRNWRSQFVISNSERQGLRHSPMAFTEHGILMLSSVVSGQFRSISRSCVPLSDSDKCLLLTSNSRSDLTNSRANTTTNSKRYLTRFAKSCRQVRPGRHESAFASPTRFEQLEIPIWDLQSKSPSNLSRRQHVL